MKLLILTQIVDFEDPTLGFFHRWIEEFAKHSEKIVVICLKEGTHNLPENVRVCSLGKEKGFSRFRYIYLFYKYIFVERNNYNAVFVHMNHEYVLLGGLWWRLLRKKVAFWYVHRAVSLRLRLATLISNIIFSTSEESFRIKTKKVNFIGHGIDIQQFPFSTHQRKDILRVVSVGRVSSSKRIQEMIQTINLLNSRGVRSKLIIVGAPVTEADKKYTKKLQDEAHEDVIWKGSVPHNKIQNVLRDADVFINLSTTNSLDKAVLEAVSSGLPVVTSNIAFKSMLDPYGLFVPTITPELISKSILSSQEISTQELSKQIQSKHALNKLIERIVKIISI